MPSSSLNKDESHGKKKRMSWLYNNISHALAPVFGYQANHNTESCEYCRIKLRHKSDRIKETIPLRYQELQVSHKLNRFGMIICLSDKNEMEDSAHANTLYDILKQQFGCKIIRRLDSHLLPPTKENIKQEVDIIVKHLQVNNHLFIYTFNNPLILNDILTKNSQHYYMWIVDDAENSKVELPYVYNHKSNNKTLIRLTESAVNTKIHWLYKKTDKKTDKQNEKKNDPTDQVSLTRVFIFVMERARYRISIIELLKRMQDEVKCPNTEICLATSYPVLNLSTTYFGFG